MRLSSIFATLILPRSQRVTFLAANPAGRETPCPEDEGRSFRQSLFRGLKKARKERRLIRTGHNPMKLCGRREQGIRVWARNGQTLDVKEW